MNELGLNILDRRKSLNLTQEELSKKLNITRAYLSNLERGKQKPSYEMLLKLEKALELNQGELMASNATKQTIIRRSRNKYRPVSIKGTEIKGYLISFNSEGNLEDRIGYFATIELENGEVVQYDAYKIKFDDV